MKTWRAYERLIALLASEDCHSTFTVIPNARITGHISKRKRQIDILVEYRYDSDLTRRIVIDAKERKRPIDVNGVEAFEGLMRDVQAKRGVLVCSNGYTKAALRRAQDHIGIKIIPAAEIEKIDLNSWDACLYGQCTKGLVLWDANPGVILDGVVSVQSVGKCDECGRFHIWCWDCGNKHYLENEDEWQCACKNGWFWLTCIEDDEEGSSLGVYLLLVLGSGDYTVVDRRPL